MLNYEQKREADRLARAALGISDREVRAYSLSKVLLAMADAQLPGGYEGEVHREMVRLHGETRANGSVWVPSGLPLRRDMTVGTAANGGYLVGTDLRGDQFIDLLRNRTVVGRMGANILGGLRGNVAIPKLTAGATATWLTNEATAISESNQTLSQITLTPKNVGAITEFSRQLLLQATPAIDAMIANDLAAVVGLAIDKAALEGDGTGGAPTGIANTAGIGSVTGTSLGVAGVLEFQTDVAAGNALSPESGFVTTPAVAALLAQRMQVANTFSPIWEGGLLDGKVLGYRALSSPQLTTGSMIFGDFSQLLVGEWGALELALNPYANFAGNILAVRAIQSVDVAVRHAGAFSRATSVT